MYEYTLKGPVKGNPFQDVVLSATFTHGDISREVKGFYAGEGKYKVRFMPEEEGEWKFATVCNIKSLNNKKGVFQCVAPAAGNHGKVNIDGLHFSYSDGTSYFPFGTTSYAWTHQCDSLARESLKTLEKSPFNKIRMCVFPKRYRYILNEPEYFAFAGDKKNGFDFTRFNPEYWDNLELRLQQLQDMGMEADLILFHPYGNWGFQEMTPEQDKYYLEYLLGRLASFRNVWWSLANEYHLLKTKSEEDWDEIARFIKDNDPYNHPISIHNHPAQEYDWSKNWVSHISIQTHDQIRVNELKVALQKPAINDECGYEGDLPDEWGNLSPEEIVHRYWTGIVHGVYTTHGETYLNPQEVIWWSKGGELVGESISRIRFLRNLIEINDLKLDYNKPQGWGKHVSGGDFDNGMLIYFGHHQPGSWTFDFPEGKQYEITLIDTWEMTEKKLESKCSGKFTVKLPAEPGKALLVTPL